MTKCRLFPPHLLYWPSIKGNIKSNGLWLSRDVQRRVTSEVLLNFPSRYYPGLKSPSLTGWTNLLHSLFTLILPLHPKALYGIVDVSTPGSCAFYYVSSLSRRILSKAFPFLRMRQIWQEFCNAGPEPALSKTFLFPGVQHHKLNYCLYHHQRHNRMLLEGKPALGWSVKSWKTKNVRVWFFFFVPLDLLPL